MSEQAPRGAFVQYLSYLVSVIVFPLAWMRTLGVARRHMGDDPKAVVKMGAAFVLALVFVFAGAAVMADFENDQIDGAGESHIARLQSALAVPTDDEGTPIDGENTALWYKASDLIRNREIDAADALLQAEAPALEGSDMDEVASSFVRYHKALDDFERFLLIFVYPGFVGLFFSPVVFVLGSIVNKSFEASKGVGYKPYPAFASAGLLLLGAFGIPAVFFTAFALSDLDRRSAEGQISI